MKKFLLLSSVIIFLLPFLVFAAEKRIINGTIIRFDRDQGGNPSYVVMEYFTEKAKVRKVTITAAVQNYKGETVKYDVGDKVRIQADTNKGKIISVLKVYEFAWHEDADLGEGSKNSPPKIFKSKLFPGLYCSGDNTLNCWLRKVFDWASVILASAAVLAIMAGGIMYMTSGGNPDQLGKAKKIMFNALAGVTVMVLARLFMTKILGAPWSL